MPVECARPRHPAAGATPARSNCNARSSWECAHLGLRADRPGPEILTSSSRYPISCALADARYPPSANSRHMVRRRRGAAGPLATRAMVVACLSLLPACGVLLGLDQGVALVGESDASTDATTIVASGDEVAAQGPDGPEGPVTQDAALPVQESSSPPGLDAGPRAPDAAAEAGCTPDPGWCDTHCATGPDNCGGSRQCPQCSAGNACGTSNVCACQRDPSWCNGRCGQTNDNCGNAILCGTCPSNQCQPESMLAACGTKQCGQATNNCTQTVNCGFLGILSTCLTAGQVCLADGGCCTPNSGAACGNQCGTFATDNCGRSVQCPTTCGSGRVCYANSCCTPTDPCGGACGVSRVNNCGQTVQCGCSAGAECLAANTCCVPQGCSADCVDSCGVAAASCCVDAGPEAGPADAGIGDENPVDP
jgi:hypothetical protein